MSASSANAVSFDFATSDGTATAGVDYQANSGTIQIDPGETEASVAVTVFGDVDDEGDETLDLDLSNPVNATLATASAIGTIVDDDGVIVSGLDSRPDNQTCVAPARPVLNTSVGISNPYPSLPFIDTPTKIILEPVANPRWFVLEKDGRVFTFDPDNATSLGTFLDLRSVVDPTNEGGMLGLEFHPDYPATPQVFLSYTTYRSGSMRSIVSRFTLDNVTSPGAGTTEQEIIEIVQDFENHNGGDIAFGPDGYLYLGLGDGGSGGDPLNRSQNTTRLLGSMLRLDVSGGGAGYTIPPDNPFAGNPQCGPTSNAADCPEIYAWGFRNPWRWTFDDATGQLWLADVGQDRYEEINLVELGGNYGWRCREGAHDYDTSCSGTYIDPVAEYGRSVGISITGGAVYRGSAIPELQGRYVFGDFGPGGPIMALEPDGQGGYNIDQLADSFSAPTSFGVDDAGELYFTDASAGRILKIVPAGAPTPDTIPTLLSQTGCADPGDTTEPYSGLIPYDLNALFWSDGAAKSRFIGLPNGTTVSRDAEGDWNFPPGTVIVKHFRLQNTLIETRLLMRHPDGVWAGYTYEWNGAGTDAERVTGGKIADKFGQAWIYPSESECMACHTSAAGFSLGPETAQLNGDFTYPSTGRTANQLETLDYIMAFTTPLPGPAATLPALSDPADTGQSLNDRARAWLHTNCSQCHRPGGQTPSSMDLRWDTSLPNTNACDVQPLSGNLGIANARLIAPGDAARSLVVERASRRDVHGMPPLGSNLIDNDGIALLTSWINGLPNCN